MLATENWCIRVSDKTYGPYTQDQMAVFAREGRLSGQSMVSPAGGRNWREARHYPALARFLEKPVDGLRAFGRATDRQDAPAERADHDAVNILLVFDPGVGTAGRVDPYVKALGPAFRVVENVWCVTAQTSATGVRNALMPHLHPTEPMMIVDCTRGRTTWHNCSPEIHARLTKAWVKTHSNA